MIFKKKIITAALAVFVAVANPGVYAADAFQKNKTDRVSDAQISVLREAGVSEEDINSMLMQIEAYNASDIQIENYINGLIESAKTKQTRDDSNVNGEESDAAFFTEEQLAAMREAGVTEDEISAALSELAERSKEIGRPVNEFTVKDKAKALITEATDRALREKLSIPATGNAGTVKAAVVGFDVTVNTLDIRRTNFRNEAYPLLIYKNITYYPATYYMFSLLNLNAQWSEENGLEITKGDPKSPKRIPYRLSKEDSWDTSTIIAEQYKDAWKPVTVSVIDTDAVKISVGGREIDNLREEYPLLSYSDIVYFPLTWRFAVDEFGWRYSFDSENGLVITADNYFYTANGYSRKDEDGGFTTVFNDTHYIDGDLQIGLSTDSNRYFLVKNNLSITNKGKTFEPEGWFGLWWYEDKDLLFTVDGDWVYTVYFKSDAHMGDICQCRININTGELEELSEQGTH